MNITRLTAQQLRKAADLIEKIGSLEAQLAKYIGGAVASVSAPEAAPRKKTKMSAAGRARIIAAQKVRWAKVKASQGAKPAKAKKRSMSAAAKAKIAAIARARWAKVKAAGKKAL
jgi:hypothetical protein